MSFCSTIWPQGWVLWSRSSHLGAALGATKFVTINDMRSVTLCCAPKSELSRTKKCDQINSNAGYEFIYKATTQLELMADKPASELGCNGPS